MEKDKLNDLWGVFYGKKTTLKDFLGNFYSWELFQEIINHKPKNILEVGSGTGVMSIFLSHLGFKITSIDNDKKVLEISKHNNKQFNGSVKYRFGDAFDMGFKNNSFDLVYSQGLFEHFDNEQIKRLLDEQLRVSKKVIISVPNNNYPELDFGNERLMSAKKWVKLVKNCRPTCTVRSFDYQFMLRAKSPFKTIINFLLNKKVGTCLIIERD